MDNIDEYNKITENTMPRIVLMIEDLYDLMLYTDKEVEQYIKILTQMSRAAGIHIVISTQRPSINVITGVIKANIPARISFYVPSYIDSRTIIDKAGAEKLQINGDIIFRKMGSQRNKRIQTPYITDKEIKKVIEQVSIDVEKTDCETISKTLEGINKENETDPFFVDAVQYTIREKQITASMIQRRFKVGYARAGRIIDQMEAAGIISGYKGSKPREVLLKNDNTEVNEERSNVQVINDTEADKSPKMQEKNSIFDKWWFWILTIIFALIIIGNL